MEVQTSAIRFSAGFYREENSWGKVWVRQYTGPCNCCAHVGEKCQSACDWACAQERSMKVDLTRAQTARRLGKAIGISPGSKRMLRQWKTVKASPPISRPQTFSTVSTSHLTLIQQPKSAACLLIMPETPHHCDTVPGSSSTPSCSVCFKCLHARQARTEHVLSAVDS